MVTIEQKLTLFSKLLNQSMDYNFNEELKKMDEQYKDLLQKNKDEVDKEVLEIEGRARKQADMKLVESTSKSKVLFKKEKMRLKEKYFEMFIDNLKKTINEFVSSDKYKNYLSKTIESLNEELNKSNKEYSDLTIYLNSQDYNKYKEFIKQEIENKQKGINITFKTENDIIGGVILESTENNFKIDFTINAVLKDNESTIMQELFEALEAGEKVD